MNNDQGLDFNVLVYKMYVFVCDFDVFYHTWPFSFALGIMIMIWEYNFGLEVLKGIVFHVILVQTRPITINSQYFKTQAKKLHFSIKGRNF